MVCLSRLCSGTDCNESGENPKVLQSHRADKSRCLELHTEHQKIRYQDILQYPLCMSSDVMLRLHPEHQSLRFQFQWILIWKRETFSF